MANDGHDDAPDAAGGDDAAVPAPAADPAAPEPQRSAAEAGNANTPPDPPATDGPATPAEPPIGDVDVRVGDEIRNEVRGALELADHIVKTGTRKTTGEALSAEILRVIKVTAGKIGLFEETSEPVYLRNTSEPVYIKKDSEPVYIKASEWTRFELAYYALVEFTSPVTAETLRNTRGTGRGSIREASSAQKFTWLLWFLTLIFAAIVIACGVVATGADNATPRDWARTARLINAYVPIIVPWVYGGLGACAFLLRTAHSLIAERSFDVRRKPEYLNRILLGMVSGGAIVLLFNPSGEDDAVKISAAALGFIAGYSNDLLFNAVERVVAAILPRVGLETLKKEPTVARAPLELPTGDMTLKDLMDRMEKANADDKELYRSLIAKLRDRL